MIKVMTFNIRYGLADDGDNHWDRRKSLVLARIQAFQPDLSGLQECRDDAQVHFVKSSLPDYYFYGVRRANDNDTGLEMTPLLVRQTAFQILQTGHFWLSATPQIPGSKSWGSTFARTTVWARLKHKPTGRVVTFVNTHFDYQPTALEGAARLMREWLDQVLQESPVIVTGDFNADKDSVAYQLLTAGGKLRDAYRQAHGTPESEATFHGFGQSAERKPIDWILVSEHFRVVNAQVDQWHVGQRFPSDHYPVLAVLTWKEAGPAGV